jgi:nucleotide-binding universal stress UspA family protein
MYRHILVPTDGSALSEEAVTHAMAFARAIGAKVTAVAVSEPFHVFALDPTAVTDSAAEYDKNRAVRAAKHLDVARDAAARAGVSCETLHVVAEHPYEVIIKTASDRGCDLIFMASHGRRGMSALVLGSETTKVLTHTRIPVLVYR